jgi:hypothetical protein
LQNCHGRCTVFDADPLDAQTGEGGTRKLLSRYGDRLVAVRHCYDEASGRRLKTVELIVSEADWAATGDTQCA